MPFHSLAAHAGVPLIPRTPGRIPDASETAQRARDLALLHDASAMHWRAYAAALDAGDIAALAAIRQAADTMLRRAGVLTRAIDAAKGGQS